MANSAQFRQGVQAFVQRKSSTHLKNFLTKKMPTLEMILAINGDKDGADGLGRPRTDPKSKPILSGRGSVKRESIVAEREYLPTIQTTKPAKTDVKRMRDRDNDPTVPNWDTTNAPLDRIKQPRFHFARMKMPYKVPHSDIRTAMNGPKDGGETTKAIGSVYELEVKSRMAALCEVLNDDIWGINGSQGYPTDEDSLAWDYFHSIPTALKADNVYGGVDRALSANDWWRGNYDQNQFTGSFYDLIDDCNYTKGMTDYGLGVQIIGVGKSLFRKAKAEAIEKKQAIYANGIPEFPEFGFQREIVRIGTGNSFVYIYYDPSIPEGHAAALDPSTFTVCIHPDGNFNVSKPVAANEVDEGGDEADFGTIVTDILWCCDVPKGNAYYTNVAY
jgi:hypothetical protein